VSPYLTGDYGSDEAPEPVSIVANDPDNSGLGFGTGDTLTLSFSRPTNRDTSTDQKLYVDSLLTFSPPVGDDYSGEWVDDSTFVVTLLSVGQAAPALGTARATVGGAIRDRDHTRPSAAGQSAVLSGNYGLDSPPAIVSFVADDPFDLDAVYGAGDTLTLTLNMATNRGVLLTNLTSDDGSSQGASPESGMALVDRLFDISTPLGSNYTGRWLDDSTFRIVIIEPPDLANAPAVGITMASLKNQSNIRNRAGTTLPSTGIPVELTGDFGAVDQHLVHAWGAGEIAADDGDQRAGADDGAFRQDAVDHWAVFGGLHCGEADGEVVDLGAQAVEKLCSDQVAGLDRREAEADELSGEGQALGFSKRPAKQGLHRFKQALAGGADDAAVGGRLVGGHGSFLSS
jgi:hypothetical protein